MPGHSAKSIVSEQTISQQYGAGVLKALPQFPSPIGSGWCVEDGKLAIDWTTGETAHKAVREPYPASARESGYCRAVPVKTQTLVCRS